MDLSYLRAKLIYIKKVLSIFKKPRKVLRQHDFSYRLKTRGKVDCYLITMNQSGTHWLRIMIAKALVEHFNLDYEFTDIKAKGLIDDAMPPYYLFEENPEIPWIQHAHYPYCFLFKNKNVILLIRDLRDSLVSKYEKYVREFENPVDFSTFLKQGYKNNDGTRTYSLEQKVNFLNSWYQNRDKANRMIIVKYEDLKDNTKKELKKVLDFIGLEEINEETLEKAVAFGDIDNMKKLEAKESDSDRKVVNVGKKKRHEEHFNARENEIFEEYIKNNLIHDYGYSLNN